MFYRKTASILVNLQSSCKYTSIPDALGPIVEQHASSSFFARGIKAVYQTNDISVKLGLVNESIMLFLQGKIPLFDYKQDKTCYEYLHSNLYDESQQSYTESYTWAKQASLDKAWKYPLRPREHEFVDAVKNHRELNVPQDVHIVHALAHVELNAVEIYLDTVLRFACHPSDSDVSSVSGDVPSVWNHNRVNRKLPGEFVHDIQKVIQDEARHFSLCEIVMKELSEKYKTPFCYGSLPLVNNQVQYSLSTRHCLMERLSVISLSQEARGLDATPRFVERQISLHSPAAAQQVEQIGTEEEAHVAFGIKWQSFFCFQNGLISTPSQPLLPIPQELELGEAERAQFRGEADLVRTKEEIVSMMSVLPLDHQTVAAEYQRLVQRHYPEGLFPPFNRLSRYLAGMPESFYLPQSCSGVQPARWFFSIPSSAKADSPIRRRYLK